LDWPSGWAYMAVFGVLGVSVSLWLAQADPDLLAERMKSPIQRGQKSWDRWFLGGLSIVYFAWLVAVRAGPLVRSQADTSSRRTILA
jgi:hypothetical protein